MSGLWAVFVIVDIAVTYACFMKGKKAMGWIGVVGLIPPLTFGLVLVPLIGAMTPAKPGSKWARQPLQLPAPPEDAWRYALSDDGPSASHRDNPPSPGSPAQAFLDGGHEPRPSGPDEPESDPSATPHSAEVRAFLKRAAEENVIDWATYAALITHLERTPTKPKPSVQTSPTPTRAPVAPSVPKPQPPITPPPVTTPKAPPTPPMPAPSQTPPPPPPVAPLPKVAPTRQPVPANAAPSRTTPAEPVSAPKPPPPPVPREPSAFAKKRDELWEAFTSDVAVHGLVYLGVLLTFVSVLGFMLFAFTDLPVSSKPFVELLIVLTFFGWAWVLNHQNATRVAKAMELLGGMILPLVWYAAIVDSAEFPPDAEGGSLVVALVVSSLAISVIYWLISRRFENSMLRFLVWPMVWVAAMGAGFAFKTDEHLAGDAITRLVAEQPALASVAIAASLILLRWRSGARLAEPTYVAALVGIPAAYLLTFGLSLGDGVSVSWPIIVSGAGTVVSIELVAHWYSWQPKLQPLRPYVYALVGVPLVLAIGIGWGGAIVAVSYVILAEIAIRSPKINLHDVASAAAGAVVGLLLSLAEPGAAVVAFGTVSIWAHVRRRFVIDDALVAQTLTAVAALAPLGLLFGLTGLTTVPAAILIVASIVLIAALALRLSGHADNFDSVWFPAAATLLGVGAAVFWVADGASAGYIIASLGVSTVTVSVGQRWPTANLWLGSALATLAIAISLDAADVSAEATAAAWSSIGVLAILTAMITRGGAQLRVAPGHVAVLGHVIGLFAFTASAETTPLTIAITGWAIGWVLSFAASEARGRVNPFDVWPAADETEHPSPATLETYLDAIAPAASAAMVMTAVVAVFLDVTTPADSWKWVGAVVGVVAFTYALATRWLIRSDHGRAVFGWTAAIVAVAGVGLSYAEPWAIIVAAAIVVAVRIILHGVLALEWLTWVTWLTPAVSSTALAYELGLAEESLALVPLATGAVMLLAALVADEIAHGPRVKGQFTRAVGFLRPASIGAALIPASVAALYVAESPADDWATSAAALALSAVSVMLRRSVWLTASLASVALGLGLHAADVPAVWSATVWSILGLAFLGTAILVPRPLRDDIAGIGHAVGAIGLGYAFDETALLIALSAWALGWIIGVTASELGGPSISNVLERSSTWWDESYGTWTTTAAQGFAPAAAVASSTAAVLVAYDRYASFTDARSWTGAAIGVLGFAFALAGAHLIKTRAPAIVFGWGGLIAASFAIVLSLPVNLPIATTAILFIATRIAVAHLIPDSWLTWLTWLMPTVAITAISSEMGVPDDSITAIPIITGGVMLIVGLLADQTINGRRAAREYVRTQWLVAPTVLGATFMLIGIALLRDAETGLQIWAGAGVALTFAAASLLLRLSIWLTSALGAIGLALLLESLDTSAIEGAIVWTAIGLVILAAVPLAKDLPQSQVAAIGHLFGIGAFVHAAEPDAYLIALGGWTAGWIGAVAATEIGRPSVSSLFDGTAWLSESEHRPFADRVVKAVPGILAVTTSTVFALTAYDRFVDPSVDEAWVGGVLAALGLVFAASARFVVRSEPTSSILGWSGLIVAGAGVVAAIGNDLPIVATASAFVVVRLLLIGPIPQTWLSWPAWLMPTLVVVAAGHAVGIPNRSLYLLSLASGALMMIGSLVVDDARNGRRAIGEGLRTAWLRYPFVIGLLLVPLSLAPVFALDTTIIGVASLGAALGYLVAAVLLRAGTVSAPALGLAALGAAALLPRSAVDDPWILVAMAFVMAGWSFLMERFQSAEAVRSIWTRWDLPALVMAHLVAVTAVLLTFDGSPDPATWIAAGALSMIVGAWRRNRWWIDAGLLLVVVGSGFADDPWLLVALTLASARGMYGVRRDEGLARNVDHAIALTAFVAAWVDLALLADWTYLEIVSHGSLASGMVVAVIGVLSWARLAEKDTFTLWTAVGLVGIVAAAIAGFNAEPIAVEGPWLAIGIALIAASSEQWARVFHANIRFGTPVVTALAWVVLLVGADMSDTGAAASTAVIFGSVLLASVLVTDRVVSTIGLDEAAQQIDTERVWAIVALTGIIASTAIAVSLDAAELWWSVAIGLLLTTVAVAIGSRAVGVARLRIATGVPALGAITAALMALDVSMFGIGISMIVASAVATLITVWFANRHRESDWVETTLIAGAAAIVITVPLAISELPETELIVMILVALGAQAIAYGIAFARQSLVALGPPALGLATIMLVSESASGTALWYTVPVAAVMLAEADILYRMTARDRDQQRSVALLVLEWAGVALLALPSIVEMFTTNVAYGLVGFGFAVALLIWALLTRVKRRVLAAAVVATLSTMLTLAAAATSNVEDNAAFWIIGGGIGFSIMLIAGFVEAYRSRSGALMRRLGDLMEDWE